MRRFSRIRQAQTSRRQAVLFTSFWFGVLFSLSSPLLTAQELIANNTLTNQVLTRNQARLYFTMRLDEWPDRQAIRVFVLPDDHPLHRDFSKAVLRLFPYQLRRVWDRQVFSGTGRAPVMVATEQELVERVAATPGAIGYVRSGANLSAGAQVVEVR